MKQLLGLNGGADESKFSVDSNTGDLSFNSAPDYENPTDDGNNNTYVVVIKATDSVGYTSNQTLTVTINNIGPLNITGTNNDDVLIGNEDNDH